MSRGLSFLSALLLAGPGLLTQASAQNNELLKRARQRMVDSIGSSQDFICTLSIEQGTRPGPAFAPMKPAFSVQAGVINGKELYAKPDGDSNEAVLLELMDQGAKVGSGPFAVSSRQVFLTNAATFFVAPEDTYGGKKIARWEFTMPKESSKYAVAVNGKPVTVGYSGVFAVDPETGDVVKMEIHPDGLPAELGLKDAAQTLEYARVPIQGVPMLVPKNSELVFKDSAGKDMVLRTRYEGCKLYTTNLGLKFVQGVSVATSADSPVVAGPRLPPRLTLDLTLEEPLDEKTATPGTKLSFKVSRDVKSEGKVLVKKGSTIGGHLTRISRQEYRFMEHWRSYYIVGIQLDGIEGSEPYAVVANLEVVGPTSTLETFLPYSQAPDKWGLFLEVRDQLTFPPRQPGESIVGVVRPYLRIPGRLRFVFTTEG